MFIVQACYYFGNFEIQVWQIPCICNVLQSTAAVFMQYVKTYFRTFQYNIFLHKYYCRLFVPNQRTQFYLKRLLTYVLLAANLISNYSIRTAYYAVTKKEGPCSANSLVTKPQTSPNACVTGPSEPGQSPPSPN